MMEGEPEKVLALQGRAASECAGVSAQVRRSVLAFCQLSMTLCEECDHLVKYPTDKSGGLSLTP